MKIVKGIDVDQEFGMLTAICKGTTKDSAGAYKIACQCECGTRKEIASSSLRSGKTTSCGCQLTVYHNSLTIKHEMNFDMSRRYGLLQPLSMMSSDIKGNRRVHAKCTGCNKSSTYLATNLRNGYSRTCGNKECVSKFHEMHPDAPAHPKTDYA